MILRRKLRKGKEKEEDYRREALNMGVPMTKYRCTECNYAVTKESKRGVPRREGCTRSRDGKHHWIVESKF